MKNFIETTPSPKPEKMIPPQEEELNLKEIREQIFPLLKICDNSDIFLDISKSKLGEIKNIDTLNEIRLNLEKINAGIMSLANFESSDLNDVSTISERIKSIELIISGWSSVKKILQIETSTRIEATINKITRRYAN